MKSPHTDFKIFHTAQSVSETCQLADPHLSNPKTDSDGGRGTKGWPCSSTVC